MDGLALGEFGYRTALHVVWWNLALRSWPTHADASSRSEARRYCFIGEDYFVAVR